MGGKVLELESERLKAEGRTEGEAIGQVQGETRLGSLITRLLQDQRTEEIPIVSTDAKRREQLYKKRIQSLRKMARGRYLSEEVKLL